MLRTQKKLQFYIDGITGKLTIAKFTKVSEKVEPTENADPKNFSNINTRNFFKKIQKKKL